MCLFHRDLVPDWTRLASGIRLFFLEPLAISQIQHKIPLDSLITRRFQ